MQIRIIEDGNKHFWVEVNEGQGFVRLRPDVPIPSKDKALDVVKFIKNSKTEKVVFEEKLIVPDIYIPTSAKLELL